MSASLNLLLALASISLPMSGSNVSVDYSNNNTILRSTQSTEGFVRVGGWDTPAKHIDCDDGYVYYTFNIYKMDYTPSSNLYIVHTQTSFVPGHVARENGDKKYKDYFLKKGYVHLKLIRASDGNGNYGGSLYPKCQWPSSDRVKEVKTSSTTTTFSYGYGKEQGVYFGSDSVNISVKDITNATLTFSFTNTVSSEFNDPRVSAQMSSDLTEAQWNFVVNSRDVAGAQTFTFDQYFLFEMTDDYSGMSSDAFNILYTVQ